MNVRLRVLAIAAAATLPLTAATAQRANSDSAQVAAILTAVFAAQDRNDMAALDTLYAGEALTVIEGASINRGWTDFRETHLGPELAEMKNHKSAPGEIEVHVAGGTAWVIFRYTATYELPTRSVDAIGRGTAVFEKVNGKWKIRHYHAGGRARRPTDPPGN